MNKNLINMQDIRTAVKTIKTAILKSRYMAARKANVEHLKLYFRVGAYVSANSRNGTWGTGAIAAFSEQLSLELPGLRGFSPSNMKNMRQFFEAWSVAPNRQLTTGDLKDSLLDETLPAIRQLPTGELTESDIETVVGRFSKTAGGNQSRRNGFTVKCEERRCEMMDNWQPRAYDFRHGVLTEAIEWWRAKSAAARKRRLLRFQLQRTQKDSRRREVIRGKRSQFWYNKCKMQRNTLDEQE